MRVMETPDIYTADCVLCERKPCLDRSDFCQECTDEYDGDAYQCNFGRCYFCKDFHDHESCIGVPCQCGCPPPEKRRRDAELDAIFAKLTPREREVLGRFQ